MVVIQNQHGNTPLKWDHTRTVLEIGDFDKFTITVDGSGRLTDRNRKFLQLIKCYKRAISPPEPVSTPAPA